MTDEATRERFTLTDADRAVIARIGGNIYRHDGSMLRARGVNVADEDAAELLAELRQRGYDPIIRQRRTYAMVKRCHDTARNG